MIDQRGQLLRAALGFAGLPRPSYDRSLWALRTWLDSWAGIGRIAVGMARRGFDLQLTRNDERGWRHWTASDAVAGGEPRTVVFRGRALGWGYSGWSRVAAERSSAEPVIKSTLEQIAALGRPGAHRLRRWSADRRTQIAAILLCCGRVARSDRNLTAQVKDKLVDFDAGRPGGGYLRESLLSRFLSAFCLNSERAGALYNVGVHWSPVGVHWPPSVEIVPE